MRLIGLSGLKTSGKDATYHAIKAALPDQNVQRVAFADKLKLAAAKALGLTGPEDELVKIMDVFKESATISIHCDEWKETITGREYLQWFGTEAGREVFGREFWVDLVLPPYTGNTRRGSGVDRAVEDKYPAVDVLVVTDARFPNEAIRIQELGGEMCEILRPGLQGDGHASEISLPDDLVDYTIINDSTLDDLAKKVKSALYSTV